MKYKYLLTVEFETEKAVKLHDNALIQFENGLPYFAEPVKDSLNNTFVYGSGKTKLKKLKNNPKVLK